MTDIYDGGMDGSGGDDPNRRKPAVPGHYIDMIGLNAWAMIFDYMSPEDWLALRSGSRSLKQVVDSLLRSFNAERLQKRYSDERFSRLCVYENALADVSYEFGDTRPLIEMMDRALAHAASLDLSFERLAKIRGSRVVSLRGRNNDKLSQLPAYQHARREALRALREPPPSGGSFNLLIWIVVIAFIAYVAWVWCSS